MLTRIALLVAGAQALRVNLSMNQKIEDISHILMRRDKLKIDCDDLINHEKFILVSVKDCYEN